MAWTDTTPCRIPVTATARSATSRKARSVSSDTPAGERCSTQIPKCGGSAHTRSTTSRNCGTPSSTTAETVISGPCVKPSAMTPDPLDSATAASHAGPSRSSAATKVTPRAPEFTAGFTTSGRPLRAANAASAPGPVTAAKSEVGTPCSRSALFMTSLSVATSAVSSDIPGRPRRAATWAITGTAVSEQNDVTPSTPADLAQARLPSLSSVLTT